MYCKTNKFKNILGFSLIELSIVFLIMGLILSFSVQFLAIYTQKHLLEKTNENLDLTQNAMEEYFALKGRYPCPADPTLSPADANFGKEQCRPLVTEDCTTGVPANIVCTSTGSGDADNNGTPDIVLIGAIPFKDLYAGIVDTPFVTTNAQDAYNMNLTYAVSEKMTDKIYTVTNPANFHLGAITVLDENDLNVTDPPSSSHFIIVSHGENRIGAYTNAGIKAGPCLTGLASSPGDDDVPAPGLNASGIAPEKENCDANDAIFIAGLRNLGEGSDFYDDSVRYSSNALISHWTYSLASTEATIYNTNLGNVGIGVTNPEEKLHVAKNLSAESSVGAVSYCKQGIDPDCVFPNAIAGVGSSCPSGYVAKGISENKLVCVKIFITPPTKSCPDNEFLVGISNLGNIYCEAISE